MRSAIARSSFSSLDTISMESVSYTHLGIIHLNKDYQTGSQILKGEELGSINNERDSYVIVSRIGAKDRPRIQKGDEVQIIVKGLSQSTYGCLYGAVESIDSDATIDYQTASAFFRIHIIPDVYKRQDEILHYAGIYLVANGVFEWLLGLLFVYRNALQGMGRGVVPLIAGGCELFARVVVAFVGKGIGSYMVICLCLLYTSGCDFTGNTIDPGASYRESELSYECNQFIDDDMKLFNTRFEDLQFIYEVTSIVFSDGSSIEP